jgi:hypothetical protein
MPRKTRPSANAAPRFDLERSGRGAGLRGAPLLRAGRGLDRNGAESHHGEIVPPAATGQV